MKTLLHVGCGHLNISHLPLYFQNGDWEEVRLDIDENVNPDVVGSLLDMSIIETNAVDAVYSSHNIEHVWGFEVPVVIKEFSRVLSDNGLAFVFCPDLTSVCQAVLEGQLNNTLYISPAGPISAMDILYGFQKDLANGRHYMAHKTGFTIDSLAFSFLTNGFSGMYIARDKYFGLHGIAVKTNDARQIVQNAIPLVFPKTNLLIQAHGFGCLSDIPSIE